MTDTKSPKKPGRNAKKTGPRKRAARQRNPEPRLSIPDDKTWNGISVDFFLTKSQALILGYTIYDALREIKLYDGLLLSGESERAELVTFLTQMARQIRKFLTFLEGKNDIFNGLIAALRIDQFGELFSVSAVHRALGKDLIQEDPEGLRMYLESKGSPIDMTLVEEYYAGPRRDLALLRGHELLTYFLRFLGDPLESWLALNAANKGGRPKDARRRYVIERLYDVSPKILGAYPPISVTSPFVDLCERVLPACGFSEKGIDKLVVSVVRRKRRASTVVKASGSPAR
jgi:hypothetical protein